MDHEEREEQPQVNRMVKAGLEGQTKKVPLCQEKPDKKVITGAEITKEAKRRLILFLRNNEDILIWSPKDLKGVSREIIQHTLNVYPNAKPKKQKLQKASKEREEAVKAEVQKLLNAGVVRKVLHSEWLANPVLVK